MVKALQHILCIDDDVDILEIARMCLETVGGYTLSTANSGREALEKTQTLIPDIILLDVMMPGMDGPSTLQELRKNPALRTVPVIFMTARIRTNEVDEYLAKGANGVIAKPFDPMALSAQVLGVWEKFRAES